MTDLAELVARLGHGTLCCDHREDLVATAHTTHGGRVVHSGRNIQLLPHILSYAPLDAFADELGAALRRVHGVASSRIEIGMASFVNGIMFMEHATGVFVNFGALDFIVVSSLAEVSVSLAHAVIHASGMAEPHGFDAHRVESGLVVCLMEDASLNRAYTTLIRRCN